MTTEESREVAEARWLDDALAGLAENFCRSAPPCPDCVAHVSRVVEAVRKNERERAYIEGWNAGVSASGGSELLHLVAAPAEGGTEG